MLKTFLLATAIFSFLGLAAMGSAVENHANRQDGPIFLLAFLVFALSIWGYLYLSDPGAADPIRVLIPIW